MTYTQEVLKRAKARLAQAKEAREAENQAHLRQAYAKVPRLRQIDMELRQNMAQAVQAAFERGDGGAELLEEARQKNQALQREREALANAHFEEGYLDEGPICDRCGGTGYVGTRMCECLAELCRQEQKKEVSILSGCKETFNQFRLDYYPDKFDSRYGASPREIMERTLQNSRRYAATFTPASGNLLFAGGTGLGKTYLSACIARSAAERGYSVVYESAPHLFTKLEQAKFNPNEDTLREANKLAGCDLLILDDLGTEIANQFTVTALYTLINDRLNAGNKPMVISTNLNAEELTRRYSPQIASRLLGPFQQLIFVGEDIRMLKNRRGL